MEDKFMNEIIQRLVAIEVKLESIIHLKEDFLIMSNQITELKEKDKQQQKEIDEIKDKNKWLERAILGAIISGTVSLIFIFIKIGVGV